MNLQLTIVVISMIIGGTFIFLALNYTKKTWVTQRRYLVLILLGVVSTSLNIIAMRMGYRSPFITVITGGYILILIGLILLYPPLKMRRILKKNKKMFPRLELKGIKLFGNEEVIESIREAKILSDLLDSNVFLHLRGKKVEINPLTHIYGVASETFEELFP